MSMSVLVAATDAADAERVIRRELAQDGMEVLAVIEPREVVVMGLRKPSPFAIYEARVVMMTVGTPEGLTGGHRE